jgi:hypothetical protein
MEEWDSSCRAGSTEANDVYESHLFEIQPSPGPVALRLRPRGASRHTPKEARWLQTV